LPRRPALRHAADKENIETGDRAHAERCDCVAPALEWIITFLMGAATVLIFSSFARPSAAASL